MPDPLCRARDLDAARTRAGADDPEARLTPPDEFDCFRRAVGTTMRQLRAVSGRSQETLGRDADMHRNYIGALERGELNPTLRTLCHHAYALEVPLSDLLFLAGRLRVRRSSRESPGE